MKIDGAIFSVSVLCLANSRLSGLHSHTHTRLNKIDFVSAGRRKAVDGCARGPEIENGS